MKLLKSLVIGAALLLYMHEQKVRDESDDLSLARLLNNATRVLVGQKSHQTFSWGRRRRTAETLTQIGPVFCERHRTIVD